MCDEKRLTQMSDENVWTKVSEADGGRRHGDIPTAPVPTRARNLLKLLTLDCDPLPVSSGFYSGVLLCGFTLKVLLCFDNLPAAFASRLRRSRTRDFADPGISSQHQFACPQRRCFKVRRIDR